MHNYAYNYYALCTKLTCKVMCGDFLTPYFDMI